MNRLETIIAVAKLAASLIPAVISLIRAAESAFPGSGQGPSKLSYVLGVVEDLLSDAKDLPLAEVIAFVKKLVARTVSVFNANGEFAKHQPSVGGVS